MKDLKYRFDELITTINLLPDEPDEMDEAPVFPNLTRDMAEPELYTAVLCQSMKGDVEFRGKMSLTLTSSAMKNVMENEAVSDDDLYALSVAANICWASGSGESLFGILGVLGSLAAKFDVDIPELTFLILRPNQGVDRFADYDPYRIISGDYTTEEIVAHATKDLNDSTIEEVKDALRSLLNKDNE